MELLVKQTSVFQIVANLLEETIEFQQKGKFVDFYGV